MSLLDEQFEDFTVMNKAIVDDGYGGTKTVWSEGASIKAAVSYRDSDQMRVAQALGSVSMYYFICRKDLAFDFHDVVKRDSDGKYFRLTTNSDDFKTPKSAGLNMRIYDAEELTALPR